MLRAYKPWLKELQEDAPPRSLLSIGVHDDGVALFDLVSGQNEKVPHGLCASAQQDVRSALARGGNI